MKPVPQLRRPPFCPNGGCPFHRNPTGWRFKRKGFYLRAAVPHRIQRFLCVHCNRSFSSQTFHPTYWLRRPELLAPLFHRLLGCSAFRQIARELDCDPTTLMRQCARLGRHCLLFHEALRPRGPLREPLVLDGFRSFEFGQYWPCDFNLAVGPSHYLYGFTEAELRRSGTMTPAQQRRRAELERRFGRPSPRATERAVYELLATLVPPGTALELRSDEHAAYPRAVRRLGDRDIRHATTSSRVPRTPRNPLFPVNLADLLIRHGSANHKRETIAFSKRRQGAVYRLAVLQVWRNYLKPVSERRRDATPAQRLGLVGRRLCLGDVLGRRLFPSRFTLPGWLERYYFGRVQTRRIPRGVEHRCLYAV